MEGNVQCAVEKEDGEETKKSKIGEKVGGDQTHHSLRLNLDVLLLQRGLPPGGQNLPPHGQPPPHLVLDVGADPGQGALALGLEVPPQLADLVGAAAGRGEEGGEPLVGDDGVEGRRADEVIREDFYFRRRHFSFFFSFSLFPSLFIRNLKLGALFYLNS